MNKFILTNDPDHGTVKNLKPAFDALREYEIKTTTAVFCTLEQDDSDLARSCYRGETGALDEPEYKDFMLQLKEEGHEIAFHGFSQISNTRSKFLEGLDMYKDIFGEYPHTYIEHGGHPEHHKPSACKRERLDWLGSVKDSEYYIKDIIESKIRCTWAYFDLLDGPEHWRGNAENLEPTCTTDLFHKESEIQLFRRSRLYYFDRLASKIKKTDESMFIGYTHFGYPGYRAHGPAYRLEMWNNLPLSRQAAKALRVNIDWCKMESTTIQEALRSL